MHKNTIQEKTNTTVHTYNSNNSAYAGMHKNTIQEKTNTTSIKNGDLQSIGDGNGDDVMTVHSELSEVCPRLSLSPSDQTPPPRDHPLSSHCHPQEYQSDAVCVCVE